MVQYLIHSFTVQHLDYNDHAFESENVTHEVCYDTVILLYSLVLKCGVVLVIIDESDVPFHLNGDLVRTSLHFLQHLIIPFPFCGVWVILDDIIGRGDPFKSPMRGVILRASGTVSD